MGNTEAELHHLGVRLERLERTNRRLKASLVGILLLAGAACLLALVPKHTGIVEAEGLNIRDKDGRVRASVEIADDTGTVRLLLFDGKGDPCVGMTAERDGKPLLAVGALGDPVISMSTTFDNAMLAVGDSDPRGQILLNVSEKGEPQIGLQGKRNQIAALLPFKLILAPPLSGMNARTEITASPDGSSSLVLYDREKVPRVSLALDAAGSPSLSLNDEMGRSRAVLGTSLNEKAKTGKFTPRPPSSLVLFDKEGKEIWSAP